MDLLATKIRDTSVFRRLLFAASFLPNEYTHRWKMVAAFASANSKSVSIDEGMAKLFVENIEVLDSGAFQRDLDLYEEIVAMKGPDDKPLGIILISKNIKCVYCSAELAVRSDRPSHLTLYTECMGTQSATHYYKRCVNSACKAIQHYGYTTKNDKQSGILYDAEWDSLLYFVSSQETAFELSFLKKFDGELLIGQISYHQKAEIYNYNNSSYHAKKKSWACQSTPALHARQVILRAFSKKHMQFGSVMHDKFNTL